jgi:hypothetical protein
MKAYFTILLLFLVLFETHCSNASSNELYRTFNFPREKSRIQVNLLVHPSLESELPDLEKLSYEALNGVETLLGLEFRDSIWIYFNSHPEEHNGLATVIPTSRIYLNVASPEEGSTLAYSDDYIADTLWHELTHLIVTQQREGVFQGLSYLFGALSRPVGAWPKWLHEGLAVWVESQKGGRGHSGIIDLQLRELAEYEHNENKSAFETFHLDGDAALNLVQEGDLPYHFGYLLIDKIFNADGKKIGQFIKQQAHSLGTSFKVELRAFGVDLDKVFSSLKDDWKKYYRPSSFQINEKNIIDEGENLYSPQNSEGYLTWISWSDEHLASVELRGLNGEEDSWLWPHFNFIPEKVFKIKNKWIFKAWSPDSFKSEEKKHFWFEFNQKHQEICRAELPSRIRELDFDGNQLTWIREDYAMKLYVESAQYKGPCHWAEVKSIYQSAKAFERVSGLTQLSKDELSFAISSSRNTQKTKVKIGDLIIEGAYPVSQLRKLNSSWCGPGDLKCYSLQLASPDYWGPVILSCSKDRCKSRKLDLSTGATDATPWGDFLVVKSFHWKADKLLKVSTSDFKTAGPEFKISKVKTVNLPLEKTENAEAQKYSPLKTIVPEFWIPLVAHDQSGTFIGANTFYEDLSQRWSGNTTLAYSSEVKTLVGLSQLERRFDGGLSLLSASLYGEYWPRLVSSEIQNRQNYGFNTQFSLWRGDSQALLMSLGVEQSQASETRFLRSYNYWSPKLSLHWRLGPYQDPADPDLRFSKMSNAMSLQLMSSYYESWATKEILRIQQNVHGIMALQLVALHAYTDRRNYPASYWEWGGRELFAKSAEDFLNRGFAPRFVAAQELMRFSIEAGYRVKDRIFSSSWNRLRMEEWEQRWVAETISWDSFNKLSRYKMGRQYFTSVGLENDLFAQVFHYSNIKNTLGIFKGFGVGGEWRVAWTLQTYLDLL